MTISYRAKCLCHLDGPGAKRVTRTDQEQRVSESIYSQYIEISKRIFMRVEDSKRVDVVGQS